MPRPVIIGGTLYITFFVLSILIQLLSSLTSGFLFSFLGSFGETAIIFSLKFSFWYLVTGFFITTIFLYLYLEKEAMQEDEPFAFEPVRAGYVLFFLGGVFINYSVFKYFLLHSIT
ncbi:hypothetical protein ACFL35_00410 [Candidatus Riflebacteria bacterium]